MDTRKLNSLLRRSEDSYQRLKDASQGIPCLPVDHGFLPDNIASFFVYALGVICPELGILFFLSYILSTLTNNRIPSLSYFIRAWYQNRLLDSGYLKEERMDQRDLIQPINPLIPLPGLILDSVCSPLRSIASTEYDNFIHGIDRRMDSLFRQLSSHEYAQFNFNGECHGLMKIWYASIVLGIENEVLNDLKAIASAVQSLFHIELTDQQKNLIKVISLTQKENITAELNSIYLMGKNKKGLIEIRKGQSNSYLCKLNENISDLAALAVNTAFNNSGCLIDLTLWAPRSAHAIGVVFYSNQFSYFDANHGRIRFTTENAALGVSSLMNLLKYKYRHYFHNICNDVGNVILTTYSSTLKPDLISTADKKMKLFEGVFSDPKDSSSDEMPELESVIVPHRKYD